MNASAEENLIINEYHKYIQISESATREVNRQNLLRFLPLLIISLSLVAVSAWLFLKGGWDNINTALTLAYINGFFWLFIFVPYMIIRSEKPFAKQGKEIARTLPGFDKFYPLYRKNYWPKSYPLYGMKRDRFLALLKGEESRELKSESRKYILLQSGIRVLWIIVIALVSVILVGAIGAIVSTIRAPIDNIANLPDRAATKIVEIIHPTPTIYPDPVTVVREVRSLARLETVQYTVEKVITAETNQGPFGFLLGDKLLLVAHGTVVAGVDLGRLQPGDIRIDAQGSVYIVIPAAEVFMATLDNEKSYVYHRETGLFAGGTKDLESAARKAAQEKILDAALEDGILDTALLNGKAFLQRFLISLGLRDVVFIDATPVPAGSTSPPLPTVTATP